MNIPLHSYDLIDELNKNYPEVIFRPGDDRDEFMMAQGARQLVVRLNQIQKREAQDSLKRDR